MLGCIARELALYHQPTIVLVRTFVASMTEEFTACKLAYILDGKLLVYLRDDFAHIPFPNMWDFPGGVREGDETAEQCVLRELDEKRLGWGKSARTTYNDYQSTFL